MPRGIFLRLKGICDSHNKFIVCRREYKNYLIARECKTKVAEKSFSEVSKLSRAETR